MSSNVTTITGDSQTLRSDSGLLSELRLTTAPPFSERRELPRTPFITVVIPVRNEAKSIGNVLNQLLSQDYPANRFELIVADGESTDETVPVVMEIAERHNNVRLYANPRRWSSAGRNIGVRQARGDIVVVVDGHCELADDQYLRDLADAFRTTGADCVGRPQPQDVSDANAFQCAVAAARSSRLGHHPDSHIYSSKERFVPAISVGVAYRRHVFEELGGFDERFDACEDVEFNYRADRAGFRCYFTPSVSVHYRPRGNLRGLFRQLARYGRGRVRLFRKHPETLSLKSFLPGLFVLGCIIGPGLAWLSTWLLRVYLGAILTYVLIVLATSVVIAIRQRKLAVLSWLPLVFLAIHLGAGAGMLVEAICGARQSSDSDAPLAARPSTHA
ncbi:MAG: glycosyltransferase family 2 protein [Planctomycetes bacterium]|nr:glycosyltransferase family 2 protein [Planctomycetota bacterium]MBL7037658.1 glycosyltransferase family 2 protein [Pirellulaceae bacterium]